MEKTTITTSTICTSSCVSLFVAHTILTTRTITRKIENIAQKYFVEYDYLTKKIDKKKYREHNIIKKIQYYLIIGNI